MKGMRFGFLGPILLFFIVFGVTTAVLGRQPVDEQALPTGTPRPMRDVALLAVASATATHTAVPPTATHTATQTATTLPADTATATATHTAVPPAATLVDLATATAVPPTPTEIPLPTPPVPYSWTLRVPILMYHYISVPPEGADKYRVDLTVEPKMALPPSISMISLWPSPTMASCRRSLLSLPLMMATSTITRTLFPSYKSTAIQRLSS